MGNGTTTETSPGRRHIIKRPRLTRLLDEADARIILLVAPAGYGKTTLAREWTASRSGAIWTHARASSADVAGLAGDISRAMADVVPGRRRTEERLRSSGGPRANAQLLAELLAADIAQHAPGTRLVIDDYHHLMASKDAEAFVAELGATKVPLLLLSRRRPSWVTPRQLLYGEVFEIGKQLLAMDPSEARRVLSCRPLNLPGLVALAEGWPAVIGLAALTSGETSPQDGVPAELFAFFADEVLRGIRAPTLRAISLLALIPTITPGAAHAVLGEEAESVLQEVAAAGILTFREPAYELHPLLRDYITREYRERTADVDALRRLVKHYLFRDDWDDAFSVASGSNDPELTAVVWRSSFDALLNHGRLETLESWIARSPLGTSPVLLALAGSEIASRYGDHSRAAALATHALRGLSPGHDLESRVYRAAGQAAYFHDEPGAARKYSERAVATARNPADRTRALWLRFIAAVELEDPDALQLLGDYEESASDDVDEVLRAATGHLILDIRLGLVPNAPKIAEPIRELVPRVSDPSIRTSFLTALGRSLIVRGAYRRGLTVVAEGEQEARQTRADFALPQILMAQALGYLGLGRLGRARSVLDLTGPWLGDPHTRANERLIRGKLLLAQQLFSEARNLLEEGTDDVSDLATRAELLGYQALACAAQGHLGEADELARAALRTSTTIEPTVVAEVVRASCMATDVSEAALSLIKRSRHIDLLKLPVSILPRLEHGMGHLVTSADMTEDMNDSPASLIATLTRREREVLGLITDGLTNAAIAQRLFISEVTVKVHVRHIFEKLGVGSRTEAATLAVELATRQPTQPRL